MQQQEIAATGFFTWNEQYAEEPAVDAAGHCLTVTLLDGSKTVCAAHGSAAPSAFHTLFDRLSHGAGQSGAPYRPQRAYLTGFRLEPGSAPLPAPDVVWPAALARVSVSEAIAGTWLDDGEALQALWEAANRSFCGSALPGAAIFVSPVGGLQGRTTILKGNTCRASAFSPSTARKRVPPTTIPTSPCSTPWCFRYIPNPLPPREIPVSCRRLPRRPVSFTGIPDGLWRIEANGEAELLTDRADALPAPDAAHAVYMDDDRRLWLIDFSNGSQRTVAEGIPFSWLYRWGDARTLLVGVWLAPGESDGNGVGHMATVDVETGELQVIDEAYVSLGRPALAPDGESVAYDVSPFHTSVAHTGYVYHPERGSHPVDASPFVPPAGEQLLRLYNPAWSPDGAQLAWLLGTGAGTRLVVFDLGQETATDLLVWPPAQAGALPPAPTWSPDGKWLAVEVWARTAVQSGVWLLPAADAGAAIHVSPVTTSSAAGNGLLWLSAGQLLYVVCDENVSNCVDVLFDVNAGTKARLDLPAGAVVLQAPPVEAALEE